MRPWGVSPENWDTCVKTLFPKWLKERGGIVVYENHMMDSSHCGDRTFMPAKYVAEDNKLHDAPDQYRPNGGLPSLRQEKVDLIVLDDFGGSVADTIAACFEVEK